MLDHVAHPLRIFQDCEWRIEENSDLQETLIQAFAGTNGFWSDVIE